LSPRDADEAPAPDDGQASDVLVSRSPAPSRPERLAARSGRKVALPLFELLHDFPIAAAHLMRHAPDVDRSEQGERAKADAGRSRAGNISAPFTAVTEGHDAADVDVYALRRIDVDVAEDHEDCHGYLRAVHLGLAQIKVDVSEGSHGKRPSL
jgi:hypothetical protein